MNTPATSPINPPINFPSNLPKGENPIIAQTLSSRHRRNRPIRAAQTAKPVNHVRTPPTTTTSYDLSHPLQTPTPATI
jgi:hypothetical protein